MLKEIYHCQCPHCRQAHPHLDQQHHRQINLLISRMDEQQRRRSCSSGELQDWSWWNWTHDINYWYRTENDKSRTPRARIRVRWTADGSCAYRRRWAIDSGKKTPKIIDSLKEILEETTAGDPMKTDCYWVRYSLK